MLSVNLTDIKGKVYENIIPLSVVFQKSENVPAHSLEVKIPLFDLPDIKYIELLSDGKILFEGDTDEQVSEYSETLSTLLVARSTASRLIDSEAYPMTFINPCTEDIFSKFVKPCGFKSLIGENKVYQGRFTVSKGTSCYSVLKSFCKKVYGVLPMIKGDYVYTEGINTSEKLEISSENLRKVRVKTLRCRRVSDVYVKTDKGAEYNSVISNDSAKTEDINKVRYINATADSAETVNDAYEIIRKSEKESVVAEVEVWGFMPEAAGLDVVWDLPFENLCVSAVKCVMNTSGSSTKLTLKRREL